ncbi:sigma-70 family RNA polymerase sigma factor [Actinokineospora iranica]|uniref:RNA polymerase sigma-70 factor, ECF subfamily n=1 Tax=Actinokineospora iranica TaxID=1271860 RepID=A0A1G6P1H0_9PSEU|nr:sigma-70 family RNA polymerase sigma factor [Actinokineospora iranica]SDC73791.1 RNA polymerase sigma-70 factor, ECF subfamily [Actinokineospora iranica]
MDAEFQDFFRHAFPKTVAVLRQMGFGLEESADSASEAMIALLTSTAEITSPLAWVVKIAIRDASRNAQRAVLGRQKAALAARRDRPKVSEIGSGQLDEVVLDLLMRLSPVRRQVIALYYQGFETYEIADILASKESTIRSHRRHAKIQLSGFVRELRAEVQGEFDEFLTLLQIEEVPTRGQRR